jgi:hypothetical protein
VQQLSSLIEERMQERKDRSYEGEAVWAQSDESLLALQNHKFINEKPSSGLCPQRQSHLVITIVVSASRTAMLGLWCGRRGLSRESTADLEVVLAPPLFTPNLWKLHSQALPSYYSSQTEQELQLQWQSCGTKLAQSSTGIGAGCGVCHYLS